MAKNSSVETPRPELRVAWEMAHAEKEGREQYYANDQNRRAVIRRIKEQPLKAMLEPLVTFVGVVFGGDNQETRRQSIKRGRSYAESTERSINRWDDIQHDLKIKQLYGSLAANVEATHPAAARAVRDFAQLEGDEAYKYSDPMGFMSRLDSDMEVRQCAEGTDSYMVAAAALAKGVYLADGKKAILKIIPEHSWSLVGYRTMEPLNALYQLAGVEDAMRAKEYLNDPDELKAYRRDFRIATDLGFSLHELHRENSFTGELIQDWRPQVTQEMFVCVVPDRVQQETYPEGH